jgi:hypothetical protein
VVSTRDPGRGHRQGGAMVRSWRRDRPVLATLAAPAYADEDGSQWPR